MASNGRQKPTSNFSRHVSMSVVTDLLLREGEQVAVRAVIAAEPVVGVAMPGEGLLAHLARLIECDAIGLALLDAGAPVGEAGLGRGRSVEDELSSVDGPVVLGIQRRDRAGSRTCSAAPRGVVVLSFGVRNGPAHVVMLWMVRRTRDFSERDQTLLGLVAPALERVLRERPTASQPSLTGQERRVLHLVAEGLSNAEIAVRLVVAPSTVSKHLENAYRKLGVTNRLAALHALEGGRAADTDDAPAAHVEALA